MSERDLLTPPKLRALFSELRWSNQPSIASPAETTCSGALAARVFSIDFVVSERIERGATFRKPGMVGVSMTQRLIQFDDDPESEIEALRSLPRPGNRYEPA